MSFYLNIGYSGLAMNSYPHCSQHRLTRTLQLKKTFLEDSVLSLGFIKSPNLDLVLRNCFKGTTTRNEPAIIVLNRKVRSMKVRQNIRLPIFGYFILIHFISYHFPIQKVLKICSSRSSVLISPVISPRCCVDWRMSMAMKSLVTCCSKPSTTRVRLA